MSPILSQRPPPQYNSYNVLCNIHTISFPQAMHRQCYEYAKEGLTYVLGDLCDNIGLVGISAKWSYVTASPSHHDKAIPILSPLLFMHVGHPYIPLFKIRRIFDLLVSPPFLVLFRQVVTEYIHVHICYPKAAPLPLLHPCPHFSSTMRFVTKKTTN